MRVTRLAAVALIGIIVPAVGLGQTGAPGLSGDNAASHMVRAAGMPLRDGELPPGMLTARVVEGGFTKNLVGQAVQVDVVGGKIEHGTTGADGRAQFAHLPVGARVRASAVVGGERLETEIFDMPAESGVRVRLVASTGGGAPGEPVQADIVPAVASGFSTASTEMTPVASSVDTTNEGGMIVVIRAVLVLTTMLAALFLVFQRRRLVRRAPAQAPAAGASEVAQA